MVRVALEHALPSEWIDAVFEEHRQRQYSRELLFSTVIELVTLVSLGLRPSLHAAARSLETLPVSLGALYGVCCSITGRNKSAQHVVCIKHVVCISCQRTRHVANLHCGP